MSERILDLDQLVVESDCIELHSINREKRFFKREQDRIIIPMLIIAILATLTRLLLSNAKISYILVLTIVIIWYFIGTKVIEKYNISENGLIVPYTWFTRKLIRWEEIISISAVTLKEKIGEKTLQGYEIELDTPLVKFNTTGMNNPVIYLTEKEFEKQNLDNFMSTLQSKKDERAIVPDTLAERLDKLVERAWKGKLKRFITSMIDGVSRSLLYFTIIEILLWSLFGISLFPWIAAIIIALIIIISSIIQFDALPDAVIGIRVNELGPIVYDEENLITNVRFIVKSYPQDVEVLNCTMVKNEDDIEQIESLKDIQPEIVKTGELTHVVAQIRGNHTKAVGATIAFRYLNEKDTTYRIELFWSE